MVVTLTPHDSELSKSGCFLKQSRNLKRNICIEREEPFPLNMCLKINKIFMAGPSSCDRTRCCCWSCSTRWREEIVQAWGKKTNCTRESGMAASLPTGLLTSVGTCVYSNLLLQKFKLLLFIQVLLLLRAAGNVLCYFFLLMRILFCKSCCVL
jgi:hypothetical protein